LPFPFTFIFSKAFARISSNLSIGNTASVPASPTPITLGLLKIPPFAYHSTDKLGTLGGNRLNSPFNLK